MSFLSLSDDHPEINFKAPEELRLVYQLLHTRGLHLELNESSVRLKKPLAAHKLIPDC